MERAPSLYSGTFVSLLLLSAWPSFPTHSWYWITPLPGLFLLFPASLLFIPDLTSSQWDELQWPKPPDLAGLSSLHAKNAGTQLHWAADAVTQLPDTHLKLWVQLSYKQFSSRETTTGTKETEKAPGLSKTILRKSSVQTCVVTAIKTLPLLCHPPLYPNFFPLQFLWTGFKISVFSFLK